MNIKRGKKQKYTAMINASNVEPSTTGRMSTKYQYTSDDRLRFDSEITEERLMIGSYD